MSVTEIRLSSLVEILMGQDFDKTTNRYTLQIERAFIVRSPGDPNGTEVEFRPFDDGSVPTGMNELASLVRSIVSAADAAPDATLRISFSGGRSIEVPPDPQYEGWNLWAPDGVLGQPAGVGFVDC